MLRDTLTYVSAVKHKYDDSKKSNWHIQAIASQLEYLYG